MNREVASEALQNIELPEFLQEVYQRSSANLQEEQKIDFLKLLIEYQDSFTKDSQQVGRCQIISHTINTGNHPPIKQAARRLPFHRRGEVQEMINKMLEQGVIEESSSPWYSPVVLVKKKDGSTRFCVDYRQLNNITKKDSYPLPRIEDILDAISGSSWFSTLDLQSGYWQIPVAEEDREKTAFVVGGGLWQFRVMPFGLCNAPATFERLMDELKNLRTVFTRLRDVKLLMNPKKCSFFQRKAVYLGHVVTENGISTNPEKISAITNWAVPRNKTDLKSFLGLCTYYRRFVKNFATIAKPLYLLTEEQRQFVWNEQCHEAFNELKRKLTSSPILAYPLPNEKFILDTDASNVGIGAVLSQVQGGNETVIAYFSKVLNKAERNYCVTRRELLGIVNSVSHFHHYLYGRKFIIRTDHAALRWLLLFKCPEGQIARWMERLQQYDFEIVHRPGKLHMNADSLSRRPCSNCKHCDNLDKKRQNTVEQSIEMRRIAIRSDEEEWKIAQEEDEDLKPIFKIKNSTWLPRKEEHASFSPITKYYMSISNSLEIRNKLLYRRWESRNGETVVFQLIVPRTKVNDILEEAHNSSSGGHFGVNKTLAKIRKRFYWANYKVDTENWCRSCDLCTARKGPRRKGRGKLQIYNTGSPFERLAIDILGPLPKSYSGNRFALVISDYFTKWPEVIPLKDYKAETVAHTLVKEVISRFGIPLEIHSDQGRSFESAVFQETMKLLGIRKTRTTALHPQSDGLVERLNRTILQYLSVFVSTHQRDWDEWIPLFLLAYRSAEHEVIKLTPSMMLFGRELRLPLDLYRGNVPDQKELPTTIYSSKLRNVMESVHKLVRKRLDMGSRMMKRRYDVGRNQVHFSEGDLVWLYQPRRTKGKCPKLQRNWEGPYVVRNCINDVVYRVQKNMRAKCKVVHVDRLAAYEGRRKKTSI